MTGYFSEIYAGEPLAFNSLDRDITVFRDIPYGSGFLQKTDWYVPTGTTKGVIIFFHGGGWTGGSKSASGFTSEADAFTNNDDAQMQLVARNGYAVVNCNYRLTSSGSASSGYGGSADGFYPNNISDVETVLTNTYVYGAGNAYSTTWNNLYDYQIAAGGKVMVCGVSAGGHLAMMGSGNFIANTINRPRSVVSISGPMDLVSDNTNNRIDSIILNQVINPVYTTPEIRTLASPRARYGNVAYPGAWYSVLSNANTKFYFTVNTNDTLVRQTMTLPFANVLPVANTTVNLITEGPTAAGWPGTTDVTFKGSTVTLPSTGQTLGDCWLYTAPGDVVRFWTYNAGTYAGDLTYPASVNGFTPWFDHFTTTSLSSLILRAANATLV